VQPLLSVAFDTFNHVSLEIDEECHCGLSGLVFRALTRPTTKVIRYGLELRRSDRVGDLKQAPLLCVVSVDQLMLEARRTVGLATY
jgi:hypothetical protein